MYALFKTIIGVFGDCCVITAFGSMKNQFLFEKSLDDKVLTSISLLVYTHSLLHGFQLLWNRRFSRFLMLFEGIGIFIVCSMYLL